ncbi:MAG: hypothetical protein ABI556_07035 [Gemmatimonadales bacterium]
MDNDEKGNSRKLRTAKKATQKLETKRDLPSVPTAKQIEQSLSRGRSLTLDEFVKSVKL